MKGYKKIIKSCIKALVPKKLHYIFREDLQNELSQLKRKFESINICYSQEGEDLIVQRLLEKQSGFFVDVGAHHPLKLSNTYLLYKQGWRGINIDAMPGVKKVFDERRPADINIEMGVSLYESELIYYSFNLPALNTFSKEEAIAKQKLPGVFLENEQLIKTKPLAAILDQYMPSQTHIDLMSIDVEGLDEQVLRSNNWDKYKPTVILIEQHNILLQELMESEIFRYLNDKGYLLFGKCLNTAIYKRRE